MRAVLATRRNVGLRVADSRGTFEIHRSPRQCDKEAHYAINKT